MTTAKLTLLELPVEIRLRIYDHLFMIQDIKVEPEFPDRVGEEQSWAIKKVNISAQLIRTCKAIYTEAHPKLYSSNIFNCSQREGLKLLLHNLGSKNFSLVRHIIIDWEQLQDFAWALAKEEYKYATEGLQVVETATWRMRVLGGNSFLWRSVKSYERQLCQSAWDICQKHSKLKFVAQRAYHKSGRVGTKEASLRVKWRFVTCEEDLAADEKIVPIEEELAMLKAAGQEADRAHTQFIDPF